MDAKQIEVMRDSEGHALLVFKKGRVFVYAITLYSGRVRVEKFSPGARRYWAELRYRGEPYPLKRAVRAFRRAGKDLGVTKAARVVLESLRADTAAQ